MDRSITFMPINPQKTWDYWALKIIKDNIDKGSMAEEEGFEPSKGFHPCRFSRPVHSTALPPLRKKMRSAVGDAVKLISQTG